MKMINRLLIVVLAVVLAACKEPEGRVNYVVWNVGDSIIHGSAETIMAAQLLSRKGIVPVYQAFGGFAIVHPDYKAYWRTRLAAIRSKNLRADVVVMSMGTNDIGYLRGNPHLNARQEFESAVREIMTKIPSSTRVLWIFPTPDAANNGGWQTQWWAISAALLSVQASYPNFTLLDYQGYVQSKGYTIQQVTTDFVHPNDLGQKLLADMIVEAI